MVVYPPGPEFLILGGNVVVRLQGKGLVLDIVLHIVGKEGVSLLPGHGVLAEHRNLHGRVVFSGIGRNKDRV